MKEQFLKAMQFRHACKLFDAEKRISDEDFQYILEVGRISPSSFGFEPWQFVVVKDPKLREKLKEGAWGAGDKLTTASHFVVALSMRKPQLQVNAQHIQRMMKDVQELSDNVIEFKGGAYAKFLAEDFDLRDERAVFDWASKQSYIALGNMMTAAAFIGIDSCPMEGFSLATSERILTEDLGLDLKNYGLSYMVAFGYRAKEQPQKTRRQLEEFVIWK